jgi:hypothetical protein
MARKSKKQRLSKGRPSVKAQVNIFDLFDCYPVLDRICFYLPIGTIVALSRSCKRLSHLYRDLLRTQWNIDMKLSRFVGDSRKFRLQLREIEAVISGSFAVQFFDRTTYQDSDLDIYVKHGDHVKALADRLTAVEGYQLSRTRPGDDLESHQDASPLYGLSSIHQVGCLNTWRILQQPMLITFIQVRTYTKPSTKSASDLKIQIIENVNVPVVAILAGFYATHVVNIITCTTAYSVFPIPTFVHHSGYMLKSPERACMPPIMCKWETRGWEFHGPLQPEEDSPTHSFQRVRRIGDRFTWKISLGTPDLDLSSERVPPIDAIQHNAFGMGKVKASSREDESPPVFSHYELIIST